METKQPDCLKVVKEKPTCQFRLTIRGEKDVWWFSMTPKLSARTIGVIQGFSKEITWS